MINILNPADCTGCGACRDICPTGAIRLCADGEGFLYPQVEESKCISCRQCNERCPVTAPKPEKSTVTAYAAQTKDQTLRSSSTSGGVFSEIATYIIDRNGVVFGAALDENMKVRHIEIETAAQLSKLRGSKYVQSEIGDSYKRAKAHLDAGRAVLFTGTPCQIGGLLAYLKRDYSNLFTQDIICHGVPSPMVWEKYVCYREKNAKANMTGASFRYKKPGWKDYSLRAEFGNGKETVAGFRDDPYMKAFLANYDLRPSCYQCAFKTENRAADLTLADFWGVEKVLPEMDDDKGTSLVLLHSEKGRALFEAVQGNLKWQETDVGEAISHNSAMLFSVTPNPNRAAFVSTVAQYGFEKGKKFLRTPMKQKIKRKIKKILRKFL